MRTHILHIYFQLKAFIIKLHLENLLEKTYGKFGFSYEKNLPLHHSNINVRQLL